MDNDEYYNKDVDLGNTRNGASASKFSGFLIVAILLVWAGVSCTAEVKMQMDIDDQSSPAVKQIQQRVDSATLHET